MENASITMRYHSLCFHFLVSFFDICFCGKRFGLFAYLFLSFSTLSFALDSNAFIPSVLSIHSRPFPTPTCFSASRGRCAFVFAFSRGLPFRSPGGTACGRRSLRPRRARPLLPLPLSLSTTARRPMPPTRATITTATATIATRPAIVRPSRGAPNCRADARRFGSIPAACFARFAAYRPICAPRAPYCCTMMSLRTRRASVCATFSSSLTF